MSGTPAEDIRNDGALVNVITGLGVPSKDKTVATQIGARTLLSERELEVLYLNGVPRRYVDAIPDEILRHIPTIKLGEEATADTQLLINDFNTYLKQLQFPHALSEVVKLQRLYGGAGLVLLIDDGLEPSEPVDPARIRAATGFTPLSRHELIPEDVTLTDWSKPAHYRISTNQRLTEGQTEVTTNLIVHHTRVARFDGLYLPWNLRSQNTGWGMSVLQLVWDAYKRYESALSGLESMTADSDLFVHKIPGLFQRLASGAEGDIRKRLEANALSRSTYGGMVVDKEEEVDFLNRALSNISSATEPFVRDLQAATGWPASILMGDSPGGLGKEGRFEERVWASLVEQWQEVYCRSPLTEVFELVLASQSGPTGGQLPESWSVHFPSVFTETDTEKTALRLQQAQVDSTYLGLQVLNALEVRQARFGGTEYTIETPLNAAITEQMIQQQEMQHESQLINMATQQENAMLQTDMTAQQAEQQAQTPPEGAQPTAAAQKNESKTKKDAAEPIQVGALTLAPVRTTRGAVFGYPDPAHSRWDAALATPGVVLGPSSRAHSPMQRLVFDHDGILTEGPYLLGFRLPAAALSASQELFPGQTGLRLRPLTAPEAEVLRAAWELDQ